MTKRRFAVEWLWYVGSIPIALAGIWWLFAGEIMADGVFSLGYFFLLSLLSAIPIYALIGLVRLTWWAIRVVTHPPENAPEQPAGTDS